MKKRILLVDDDKLITITLSTLIRTMTNYDVLVSNDPLHALDLVSSKDIDMILSDFMMPNMNGLDFLKKAREIKPDVISVILTGYADKENAIRCINEVGIYYYIEKPWDNNILLKVIQNGMEKKMMSGKLRKNIEELEKSSREIERMYDLLKNDYLQETDNIQNLIIYLANLIEAKDEYTDGHTRRVGNICRLLGKKVGFSNENIQYVEMAGIIHDIGKISISETLLNKKSKLTTKEFEIIKRHSVAGEIICKPLKCLNKCLDPIRHHHEKLNGSGYPDGFKGKEVTIESRIVAIADIFDALCTDRAYRRRMSIDQVQETMSKEVKKGLIDGELVSILFEMVEKKEVDINR